MDTVNHRYATGPRPTWLVLLLALCMIPVAPAAAQVGEGSDTCSLNYNWLEGFIWIDSTASGSYEQLSCEPIPLSVEAMHFVMLDEICAGCGDTSNKHVELQTNVEYAWTILTSDGGKLTTIANDGSRSGVTAEGKAVAYHAPYMSDDESMTVHVEVRASNSDGDKPAHGSVVGVFTIELSNEERTETESQGNWELERVREFIQASVSFAGDYIDGGGGTELIYGCDPDVQWEDSTPISGDFWAGGSANPASTLITGEVAVLSALGVDVDDMILQCNATVPDCESSGEITLQISDALEYEWSASVGSFAFGENEGSEVIYYAPEDPAITDVSISVTIRDTELQYIDSPLVVQKSFAIITQEAKASAAQSRHIDFMEYPPPDYSRPGGPNGTTLRIPYYSSSGTGTSGGGAPPTNPPGSGGYWRVEKVDGSWEIEHPDGSVFDVHPWQAVTGFINGAKHIDTPDSFPDFLFYKAWTEQLKEYWVTMGAELIGKRRHDVIREFEDYSFVGSTGKLAVKAAPGFDPSQLRMQLGRDAGFTSRVEVRIRGECTPSATIFVGVTFRGDSILNEIYARTCSRVDWEQDDRLFLSLEVHEGELQVRPLFADFGYPKISAWLSVGDDPLTRRTPRAWTTPGLWYINQLAPIRY